jgi:hypothetical protein
MPNVDNNLLFSLFFEWKSRFAVQKLEYEKIKN